jgi:hypothetical protein
LWLKQVPFKENDFQQVTRGHGERCGNRDRRYHRRQPTASRFNAFVRKRIVETRSANHFIWLIKTKPSQTFRLLMLPQSHKLKTVINVWEKSDFALIWITFGRSLSKGCVRDSWNVMFYFKCYIQAVSRLVRTILSIISRSWSTSSRVKLSYFETEHQEVKIRRRSLTLRRTFFRGDQGRKLQVKQLW